MLSDAQVTELLDLVSACQSAYHIDSTPGHRFGGMPSNLEANRAELVVYVRQLLAESGSTPQTLTRAAVDVNAERARQATMFPAAQDDEYRREQLESAAAAYALAAADRKDIAEDEWPWDLRTFKPGDQRRNLVKAGALILAAIERIDRRDAEV